jgi:hypothetical protein
MQERNADFLSSILLFGCFHNYHASSDNETSGPRCPLNTDSWNHYRYQILVRLYFWKTETLAAFLAYGWDVVFPTLSESRKD